MSFLEALFCGLLQGLTEFLPISSSAHLKFAKLLLAIEPSEGQVLFDLMCHLGTLMALLYFLREDIHRIFFHERKKLGLLFIATLPLLPCYFLLAPLRELAARPQFLGPCLMITATILFCGQRLALKRRIPSLQKDVLDALWIGTLQSTALIPGISRSASTISCAKILGWGAKDAVRFSFLLCIPTIIGGNCLEIVKLCSLPEITLCWQGCFAGFAASFLTGLAMVRIALSYLEKGNLKPFAWYCLVGGFFVTVYLNFFYKGG